MPGEPDRGPGRRHRLAREGHPLGALMGSQEKREVLFGAFPVRTGEPEGGIGEEQNRQIALGPAPTGGDVLVRGNLPANRFENRV